MLAQILIMVYLSVAGFAFTVDDCPSGLKRDEYLKVHDDTCYEFVVNINERRSFQDAQDYCTKQGGSLAIVTSESTNQYLKDILENSYKIYNSAAWIGLKFEMGEYTWVDGSKISYSNLDPDDNSGFSHLCASLNPRRKHWETYICTPKFFMAPKHRFICQYHARNTCPVKSDNNKDAIQELGNKCYYFGLDGKLSFPKASAYCQKFGGRLALVKSKEINDFLEKHLTETHKLKSYNDKLWIGLKYNESTDAYFWLDNTVVDFSNFNKYSRAKGKCATISPFDGQWRKDYCTDYDFDSKYYICEFDKTSKSLVLPTIPSKTKKTTSNGLVLPTIPTKYPPTSSKKGGCSFSGSDIDDDDVKKLDDKCYYFVVKKTLTFQKAEDFCENRGGTLAMPKSEKINQFLVHHLQVTHKFGYSSKSLWIGLRRSKFLDPYMWIDDTFITYKKFKSFRYVNDNGDCAAITPVDGEWEVESCFDSSDGGVTKNFICEFKRKG